MAKADTTVDTTVGELVSKIRSGELRLPAMQRRYVWTATRVRDLMDSLYRGYPSGTILAWETDIDAPTRDFAVGQGTERAHRLRPLNPKETNAYTAIRWPKKAAG